MNGQQFSTSVLNFMSYEHPAVDSMTSADSDPAVLPKVSVDIRSRTPIVLTGGIASSDAAAVRLWPQERSDGDWVEISALHAGGNTLNFTLASAIRNPLLNSGADARVLISLNGQQYRDTGEVLSLFNLSAPAVINSVKPASGTKEGGTTVKVNGNNFAGRATLRCRFETSTIREDVIATFESSRSAICATPPNLDGSETVPAAANLTITNDFNQEGLWSVQQHSFRYTETSPANCTAKGPGLDETVRAGDWTSFTIFAKTAAGTPRENGGDQFYVSLARSNDGDSSGFAVDGFVVDLDVEYVYIPASLPSGINQTMIRSQQYLAATDSFEPQPVNATTGSYLGLYNVTLSGIYDVVVTSGGIHIAGSPFEVHIHPSDFVAQNSLFVRRGWQSQRSTAGDMLTFDLYYRDRYGNQVAHVDPRPVSKVWFAAMDGIDNVSFSVNEEAVFRVRFTANVTVAGEYQTKCLVDSMPAAGSDLPFTVEPAAADPIRSSQQLEATFVVNANGSWTRLFKLEIRDEFGNVRHRTDSCGTDTFCDDIQVSAKHVTAVKGDGTPLEAPSEATPSASSYYIVQFQPRKAGEYNLTAQLNGVLLGLDNAIATVRPAELAIKGPFSRGQGSNVTGRLGTVVAGSIASFQIDGRDRYGNLRNETDGPYIVQLKPSTRKDNEEKRSTFDDRKWEIVSIESEPVSDRPGTHVVNCNVTVSGFYDVHVSHSGEELYWSPAKQGGELNTDEEILRVEPAAPDAAQSEAWASPGVQAGLTSTCEVRLKDRFGNPLIIADGNETQRIVASIDSDDMPSFWRENTEQIPWQFAIHADGGEDQDGTFENELLGCCEDQARCQSSPPCRPAETDTNGVYVLHYRFYPWLYYNLTVALSSCTSAGAAAKNDTAAVDCGSLVSEGQAACESTGRCSYSKEPLGGGDYSEALHTLPARTPRALRAQFDDSLVRINVDFDISTNYARTLGKEDDCGNLFGHDSVFTWLLNGDGHAKCTWKSPTSLRIALGYMSKVTTTEAAAITRDANLAVYVAEYSMPYGKCTATSASVAQIDEDACAAVTDLDNDVACRAVQYHGTSDGAASPCTYFESETWDGNMTLASGDEDPNTVPSWKGERYPLTSFEENSNLCRDELVIEGPSTPLIPVARIDAPVQVGLCEPVVVRGSNSYGGGPRPLSYSWTALSRGDQAMPTLNLDVISVDVSVNSVTLVWPHSVTAGQQLLLQDAPERTCEAAPKNQPLTVLSVDGAVVRFGPSCTGTAADGTTDCGAFFATQAGTAESDCTGGDGSGCVYTNGIHAGDPDADDNCIIGFTLSTYLHNSNMQVSTLCFFGNGFPMWFHGQLRLTWKFLLFGNRSVRLAVWDGQRWR